MSQLNTPANKPIPQTTYEGAHAKRLTPEQELRRSVLTNLLWEDEFYEDGQSNAERLTELIPKCNPHAVGAIALQIAVPQCSSCIRPGVFEVYGSHNAWYGNVCSIHRESRLRELEKSWVSVSAKDMAKQ